ncbi:MAG: SDR family NAD(P)-dependent oxidoreductase [bacterium]|nr:SDR family NAD(P)-dependent oxidoreductase [bacterium]
MTKTVLVTGTSYGLGKALFEKLSENSSYNLAGLGRSCEEKESSKKITIRCDITKTEEIERALLKVKEKWGGLDVLINNAGIVGEFKKMKDYTEDEIKTMVDINIKGTFIMTQRALNYINIPGYIINIGSTRSITGAPDKTLYSMTKFALRGLTQSINAEMKKDKIYSTIVCPGSFKTVSAKSISEAIEHLMELPLDSHVPELIMGGML